MVIGVVETPHPLHHGLRTRFIESVPRRVPDLRRGQGVSFQVRTLSDRPDSIEVKLRCRECHHEWLEIRVPEDA